MLGFGQGEARLEVGEDKTLQHFDGGRQEGNGSVGGALAVGFSGFGDGDYYGLSPDGWDICAGY